MLIFFALNLLLPFKLDMDASATGTGAVPMQEDAHGVSHPVCYILRTFLKYQLNYSTIEKEALALPLMLQYFEVYVGSSSLHVVVYTDHNPLVSLSHFCVILTSILCGGH